MATKNLLNLESVSKAFDIRPLLKEVSLGISEGERIGVVGRNGGGKSQAAGSQTQAVLAKTLPQRTNCVNPGHMGDFIEPAPQTFKMLHPAMMPPR